MFSSPVKLSAAEALVSSSDANPAAQNTNPLSPPNSNFEDTVTLTAQALGSQLTQPPPQSPSLQAAEGPALAARVVTSPEGDAALNKTQGNASPTQAGTTPSSASLAVPAAAGTNSSRSSSAQQQQLSELEALLHQLGIDPASLSGPALAALLHDAADPAALLVYVKQLQGTAPPAAPPIDHVNVTI